MYMDNTRLNSAMCSSFIIQFYCLPLTLAASPGQRQVSMGSVLLTTLVLVRCLFVLFTAPCNCSGYLHKTYFLI